MKKKIFVFTPIFLSFIIIFCAVTPVVNLSENISDKVFRLHILANSDERDDQNLKLKVRDEILELSSDLFKGCKSVDEAILISNNNIDLITKRANEVISSNGYNYKAKVYTTKEYFNTREYDSFTLPAGIYDSLKIEIGKGKGHNWWCVMFPSVCISGCTSDLEEYLSEEEIELIESNHYVIRFKIVEIYEKIKSGMA